jgi:hypothetical protein
MIRRSWLQNVLGLARSHKDCRPASQQRRSVRLTLEPLEDRVVPSVVTTSQQHLPTASGSVNVTHFVSLPPPPPPRPVTITTGNIVQFFIPANIKFDMPLVASVIDTSAKPIPVNEGEVKFTVQTDFGSSTRYSKEIKNGVATTTVDTIPGVKPGIYGITASYSDDSHKFASASVKATLTILPAPAGVKAANEILAFGPQGQTETVALSANLSDLRTPSATVDEGTVTFTVVGIGTVPVYGAVIDGTANAPIGLPAGSSPGTYAIDVSYSDKSGDFIDVSNIPGTLTIKPPPPPSPPPPPPCPPPSTATCVPDAQNALIQAFEQLISDIQSLIAQFDAALLQALTSPAAQFPILSPEAFAATGGGESFAASSSAVGGD